MAIVYELREVGGWARWKNFIYAIVRTLALSMVGRNQTELKSKKTLSFKNLSYAALRWAMEKMKRPIMRIAP